MHCKLNAESIDLLNLTPETDVEVPRIWLSNKELQDRALLAVKVRSQVLINQIVFEEPLISENKKDRWERGSTRARL